MRVAFTHGNERVVVRARTDEAIPRLLALGKGRVADVAYAWEGDTLRFSFRALGRVVRGTADVTDTEVIVDVGLPLLMRPLEGRVKSRLLDELRSLLGDAQSGTSKRKDV